MKITKADRTGVFLTLGMMAFLVVIGQKVRGNSLLFSLGFPAVVFALNFWLHRARTAPTEDARDENLVVFNRQPVLRLLFLFVAIGFAALVEMTVTGVYQESAYRHYSTGDYVFCYSVSALFLGGPCLLFLWCAGPYQVRLDLRRREYALTQGLPLMPMTKHGPTEGGIILSLKLRNGPCQVRFYPRGNKWGYLLDTYGTDEAAHAQARRLADALGLVVERRDQPS